MTKIEDKVKEIWENETVRDAGIITGMTAAEYVSENIISRKMAPKYHKIAHAVVDLASNFASYYFGKSQGEKKGQDKNQNGQP